MTLQQAERAEMVARLAARGEVGRVEIGYIGSLLCSGLLAALVASYRERHPLVNLGVRYVDGRRQVDQLTEGVLDIAFVVHAPRYPSGVSALVIDRQEVMIALPRDYRLAASDPIALALMLADEKFVAPVAGSLSNFPSPPRLACMENSRCRSLPVRRTCLRS